jgi:hypothetical protein
MAQSPDATEETRLGPVRILRTVFSGVGQLLLAADRFREEEAGRLQAEAQSPTARQDESGPLDDESEQPRLLKITGNAEPPGVTTKTGKGTRSQNATTGSPKSSANPAKRTPKKTGAGRSSPQQPRFRSLDSTGNVRVLTEQDIADLAEDELERNPLVRPTMMLTEVATPLSYPSTGYSSPSYSPPAPALELSEPTALAEPTAPSEPAVSTEPISTFAPQPVLPIADYDELAIASLRARLRGLDPSQLRLLAEYEADHANRTDVITMFENRIIKLESAD